MDEYKYITEEQLEELPQDTVLTIGGINNYEFMQNCLSSATPVDEEGLLEIEEEIKDFFISKENRYYALINKELNHFTVFVVREKENYPLHNARVLTREILTPSEIISICKDTEDCREIWTKAEDGVHCFVLFPYDAGVIDDKLI